jgi:hypothetical protein
VVETMAIREADPWRVQYFQAVACPAHVEVPTEDSDSWSWFPTYRWVYNKLAVAHSQGLEAAPHGVMPASFPVFSKPIYNLHGMGIGSRVIHSVEEYLNSLTPGHMWMKLLHGEHLSSDVAVADGQMCWWRHVTGHSAQAGTFDYWIVHAEPRPEIEALCRSWIKQHLTGFTGMVNFETIGGSIIEIHLRMSDQWPDLYGPGWVEAVVELYDEGVWRFVEPPRRVGYSVALFGPTGRRFCHPPAAVVEELLGRKAISSIQITFHEDREPRLHAMPPGGFRLSIINSWNLQAGFAARDSLRAVLLMSPDDAQQSLPSDASQTVPPGPTIKEMPPAP